LFVSRSLKAVIFDFNGVIVDDEPLHLELIQQVLREEGVSIKADDCRARCLGVPDFAGFQTILAGQRQGAVETGYINQLIARKAGYYLQAIRERDLLFPGVSALIQRLTAQFPLALVSGALRQEVEFVLARSGLRDAFRAIVTAEDVTLGKPHPEGFLQGLKLLAQAQKIQPHECLVVEDSVAGVAAAKRAGMYCVAVTNSYPAAALQQADVIVANLTDFDPHTAFAASA
jgi:HAD superfamily hydrolase (TIGR01509 family)